MGDAQNVDETILYLNARNPEMEAVAAKYTQPPYNLKIMGNEKNYQIAQAMTWLIGNATNDYVLFLEKDFRLVESLDCVMEQLDRGIDMLKVCVTDERRQQADLVVCASRLHACFPSPEQASMDDL